MSMPPRLVILVLMVAAASACRSTADGAKAEFSKEFSCPEASIQVRARPELKRYDVVFGSATPTPPAEVAADPARLAEWKKRHQEIEDNWNRGLDIMEAKGCGHETLLECDMNPRWGVGCSPHPYPPGVAQW